MLLHLCVHLCLISSYNFSYMNNFMRTINLMVWYLTHRHKSITCIISHNLVKSTHNDINNNRESTKKDTQCFTKTSSLLIRMFNTCSSLTYAPRCRSSAHSTANSSRPLPTQLWSLPKKTRLRIQRLNFLMIFP